VERFVNELRIGEDAGNVRDKIRKWRHRRKSEARWQLLCRYSCMRCWRHSRHGCYSHSWAGFFGLFC